MKKIGILGSTGSIGTQTLEIVDNNPDMVVTALSGNMNIKLLEEQTRKYKPEIVAVYDRQRALEFRRMVRDLDVKVVSEMSGLIEVAQHTNMDVLVTAIVGMVGIRPTVCAIKAGKDIALANKETLVAAGHIIMPLAKKYNVSILPVDSEHSAIFQCLNGENKKTIDKLIITASGGPFLGKTKEGLLSVTLEDSLKHPNWNMGAKVTIDSSTLANKGLEIMEAKWLFSVEPDMIDVVVQPQSIIHSMIQFTDGSVMAQLGVPDMKLPIQYALTYPERRKLEGPRIDFAALKKIDFYKPDTDTFRALALAYKAMRTAGSMPAVFNIANEIAVKKYIDKEIRYLEISEFIEKLMMEHKLIPCPDLDDVLGLESELKNKYL